MFPDPAATFIAARDGEVHTACAVRNIRREGGAFVVQSALGEAAFTHVICATDPRRGAPLLETLPEVSALGATLRGLEYLPIVSVYLQYAQTYRMHAPMLGFGEGPAQWAFDRGALCAQPGLIGAVASAASALDGTPGEALAAAVDAQLRRHLFDLPTLQWHQVITERRATFACVPGMLRPAQRTVLPRFYLAGDYTLSDYPATLEAAVRSGLACARAVQEDR
jgi:predicted NAD/FAD-binding protein